MTHLLPASDKLRRRAEWIVMELAGVSREEASRLLAETEGDTQAAVDLGLRGRV
jgi:N-acetylmuramic acid 6-phosphate (MurNAc-6-P) etherase